MMENFDQSECPIFDQSQILIKRKRTKRQRAPSPNFGFSGMASSSTSPTSSSTTTHEVYGTADQEDEDMANCLILLAQGGEDARKVGKNGQDFKKMERCVESVTSFTPEKACGYECKTCNRTFPSFQALGGHRASHKKAKIINLVEDKKIQETLVPPPRHEIVMDKILDPSTPELSQKMVNKSSVQFHGSNKKAKKTHECSICGAEFTSGQALGGHMRRHRAAGPPPRGSAVQISLSSTVDYHSSSTSISSGLPEAADAQQPRNVLSLDLNLPAPEDDQRDTKFQFGTSQGSLVMSSSTLVDWHY